MSFSESFLAPPVIERVGHAKDLAEHYACAFSIRAQNALDRIRGKDPQVRYVEAIKAEAKRRYGVGNLSFQTLLALKMTDRTPFAPGFTEVYARESVALPIGQEQTTSSPETIALMLDLLDIKHDSTVLEIGAGSGYTSAVMSQLTNGTITTIEARKEMRALALENLKKSGFNNVKVADSRRFLARNTEGPLSDKMAKFSDTFDRIICCAEMEHRGEAEPYIKRLSPSGKFLAPIKGTDGKVRFYTYTHDKGWCGHPYETQFVPHVVTG